MIELKTSREIGQLREAGRVVAEALAAVRAHAGVGVMLGRAGPGRSKGHQGVPGRNRPSSATTPRGRRPPSPG